MTKRKFPIEGILKLLEKEEDFVFLETARPDTENFLSYIFLRPKRIISTGKIDQLQDCFSQLDQALKEGNYVAGFVSYEAGEAFEEKLRHRQIYDFPLLWLGIYKEPLTYDHRQGRIKAGFPETQAFIKKITRWTPGVDNQRNGYLLKNIRPNISQSSYEKAIAKIKDLIAQGFTYQVNYTFKLKFSFSGSAPALYLNLRNNQSVSYSALIKNGHNFILSFSPELFFRKRGCVALARPMKGTAKRGKTVKEDAENIKQLENCLKNRSENVMIVDLLRNDLGRISATGSVKVPRLFNVERYQTLLQMTSDIESRLKRQDLAFDIFRYIFPSGSVTGAPKIKTMQIIRQLEKEPRNVYTGSIGFFSPENSGTFNVAIRTLLIDTYTKKGEMGVGSGIVYDSCPQDEYAECCLKADFLTKNAKAFQLIETMLWRPHQGYLFLKLHLERLESSGQYFDFAYKREEILKALRKLENGFGREAYRVRLCLFKDGQIKLEACLFRLQQNARPRVLFSAKTTNSQNLFLYHKTTNRRMYDQEYEQAKGLGFYDVIFTNEKGEVTEGAISNVFIKRKGILYTPPVACGLLDGVYRRYIFSLKTYPLKEKILFKQDLFSADEVYLSNSVRGLVKVELEDKSH